MNPQTPAATREMLFKWREEVHRIADKIARVDRDLADDLYAYCDRLDTIRALVAEEAARAASRSEPVPRRR